MVPPKKIRFSLFNLRNFSETDKSTAESCRIHWNLVNDKDLGPLKCLIFKYGRGGQIIQPFCTISSPQEIRSLLFSFREISNTEKSTAESCRIHWNLIYDKEFGAFKCFILKYRGGDKISQPFCRIGSPQENTFPLFNWRKFSKTDEEWWRILVLQMFNIELQKRQSNYSVSLQNWFHPRN